MLRNEIQFRKFDLQYSTMVLVWIREIVLFTSLRRLQRILFPFSYRVTRFNGTINGRHGAADNECRFRDGAYSQLLSLHARIVKSRSGRGNGLRRANRHEIPLYKAPSPDRFRVSKGITTESRRRDIGTKLARNCGVTRGI